MWVLTKANIQAWDKYTIEHQPIASIDLMEQAALSFCQRFEAVWPKTTQVIIVAGNGNNGGDALAIGRILAQKAWRLKIYIVADPSRGSPDFTTNFRRLEQMNSYVNVEVRLHPPDEDIGLADGSVIIDGIFGIAYRPPLPLHLVSWIEWINAQKAPVVSIDVPSGICCDGQAPNEVAVKASHTFSFECVKFCFLFPETAGYVGQWCIIPIGLHPGFLDTLAEKIELVDSKLAKALYKKRPPFAHKKDFGHVLLMAGSYSMPGAGILAARACLRSGCGLLSVLSSPTNRDLYMRELPEAMFQSELPADLKPYTVIAIGPGLSHGRSIVRNLLDRITTHQRLLIDADGLNAIAQDKHLWDKVPAGTVITPHAGEFDRLFGHSQSAYDRHSVAAVKSRELQIYIVLKGRFTAVYCPDGRVFYNTSGNVALAKGGSGDVLTGILGAILGQNYEIWQACVLACYLHGRIADMLIEKHSPELILASDLIEGLNKGFLSLH